MGKRSQHKMTGLSEDQRIKESIQRKAEQEEKRREQRLKLLKAMLDLGREPKKR